MTKGVSFVVRRKMLLRLGSVGLWQSWQSWARTSHGISPGSIVEGCRTTTATLLLRRWFVSPYPRKWMRCRRHSRCFHRRSTASPRPGGIRRPSIRTEPLLRLPTCLGWLAFLPGHGQSRISYGHPSSPPQKGGARPSRGAKKNEGTGPSPLVLISCWRRLAHISPTTVRQSSRGTSHIMFGIGIALLCSQSSRVLSVEASCPCAPKAFAHPQGFSSDSSLCLF